MTHHWRSRTALTLALALTTTGLIPGVVGAAIAREPQLLSQRLSQRSQVGIPAGTLIPIRYEEAEKIVVTPDETVPVTLLVAEDVRSARGTVLIREGSKLKGELRPVEGGTQFVAEEIELTSGRTYPIDAESSVVSRTETVNRRSNPDFLKGAAIGAAAGAILGEIFGSIDLWEVLLGAGVGTLGSVLIRGNEEVTVLVVYPETDLEVELRSDFRLGSDLMTPIR